MSSDFAECPLGAKPLLLRTTGPLVGLACFQVKLRLLNFSKTVDPDGEANQEEGICVVCLD